MIKAQHPAWLPLRHRAEAAAAGLPDLIKAQLARGRARIAFPAPMYWGARFLGIFPAGVQQRLTGNLPGKE